MYENIDGLVKYLNPYRSDNLLMHNAGLTEIYPNYLGSEKSVNYNDLNQFYDRLVPPSGAPTIYVDSSGDPDVFYFKRVVSPEVYEYLEITQPLTDDWITIPDAETILEAIPNLGENVFYFAKSVPLTIYVENRAVEVFAQAKLEYSMEIMNDIEITDDTDYPNKLTARNGFVLEMFENDELRSELNSMMFIIKRLKTNLSNDSGVIHRYPRISKGVFGYKIRYNFLDESPLPFKFIASFTRVFDQYKKMAFSLSTDHYLGFVEFLCKVYYDDAKILNQFNSPVAEKFHNDFNEIVNEIWNDVHRDTKLAIPLLLILPDTITRKFSIESYWRLLKAYLKKASNSTAKDILILLKIISKIEPADQFLDKLLTEEFRNSVLLRGLMHFFSGDYFDRFLYLIWDVWGSSKFAVLDSEKNDVISKTGESPVYLPYKSDKKMSFHTDNASVEWDQKAQKVLVDITLGTGNYRTETATIIGDHTEGERNQTYTYQTEITKVEHYKYHPFSPIIISNEENPHFIYKDSNNEGRLGTTLPGFVLLAREEKAFWENVGTGFEYFLDIVTTFSGIGNILKAGRLFKALKTASSLVFKAKVVAGTGRAFSGIVEISSGAGNGLIKLMGKQDTEEGRAISEVLFYLEILSLGADLTASINRGLRDASKKAIDNSRIKKKYNEANRNTGKTADDLEVIEAYEFLQRTAGNTHAKILRNAEDFLKSAEKLAGLRITAKNALKYLDEVLPHINHKVVDGELVKIGKFNCVSVVGAVDHYLKTGEIRKALYVVEENVDVLEEIYNAPFLTKTIPTIQKTMKNGERGIIYGIRTENSLGTLKGSTGHVFNVIKDGDVLKFKDGQSGLDANLRDGFIKFKYLKTN